jgi:N,N'-diacetylchitobiose transport system permease protein
MSRRRLTRVGYNAAAVLLLLVMVFPIYWMVATGFKRGVDILSFEPRWLPIPGTLENFRSAVGKPHFLQDVRNSLVVVVVTVLVSLALAFLAALAAARFRFRGRAVLIVMLIVVQMVPL